jgi:mannose-6-phosphate isomerase
MTIEAASKRLVRRLRGQRDPMAWGEMGHEGAAVGEISFQRSERNSPEPALLLKLLFTEELLSIEVRPNQPIVQQPVSLVHGKSEAWYVISADPGAQIAVGLNRELNPAELRSSMENGSIVDLVTWYPVSQGDAFFVPPGVIHAIGPGLVIAEVQQRVDAVFSLFEHGRDLPRPDVAENSEPGPIPGQSVATPVSDERTMLVAAEQFALERIYLPPGSVWELNALRETWLLVLHGRANIAPLVAEAGEAIFLEAHRTTIEVGPEGLQVLLAHLGTRAVTGLLRPLASVAEATFRTPIPLLAREPAEAASDRRRAPRRRVLKGGTIVINDKRSTISCTIRNLSKSGALLQVTSVVGIPGAFALMFGGYGPRQCTVVRRDGGFLGVRFEAEFEAMAGLQLQSR